MKRFLSAFAGANTLAFAFVFSLFLGLAQAQNSAYFPAGGGAGGSPGGASGTIQYNNSSSFGGMSGTSWDDTNRSLTVTGATVTANKPMLDLSQTWNDSSVAFTGLKFNVTPTASLPWSFGAAGSKLLDWRVGGSSKFNIARRTDIGANWVGIQFGDAFSAQIVSDGGDIAIGAATNVDKPVGFPAAAGISQVGVSLKSTFSFAFTNSSSNSLGGYDTYISRGGAAATLMLGQADAAEPVAQTLKVQSVVAGTSNKAGVNWTLKGSAGTGTGAGGNIIVSTAPSGSSGSSQNSFIQTAVFDSSGHIRVGDQTAPALSSCGTSPAIVGDDTAGEVTMGTGNPTGCVITFNHAYAAAPLCVVNWQATPLASQSWAVSTTAITLTQTGTSSNKVNYICRARNGG